jgi:hypothetical protein
MKWHLSEVHWMQRMHRPRVHEMHLHPIHWLTEHPWAVAVLIAALLALIVIFLANRADTGIRIDTLQPFDYQVMVL